MQPYIRYLKYLISLHIDKSKIIKKMSDFNFDIDMEEIKHVKKNIMLPEVYSKYANGEDVDEDFLIDYAYEHGFGEFWEYKLESSPKEMKEVYDMMASEKARLIPLVLTIKGEKLIHNCMKDLGYEYSQKSIELMLDLFWNVKEMKFIDWKNYFSDEVTDFLEKPLDYIKYKFGINPKMEYSNILEDIMHLSYFKSKDLMSGHATKDTVSMAKKLADVSIKAGEKLEKYGTNDTETFLDDVILKFENAGIEFKGAKEVDEDENVEHEIELI